MKLSTRRLAACIAIGPILLMGALVRAQEGHPGPGKAPLAREKFKNIQVLKNLPADKLIPLMHEYNNALGVRCDFCHVVNADHTGFDRDDKPAKGVARKMIRMTEDLNAHQKILDRKATCFMCHHGHPEPETHAPAEPPQGR